MLLCTRQPTLQGGKTPFLREDILARYSPIFTRNPGVLDIKQPKQLTASNAKRHPGLPRGTSGSQSRRSFLPVTRAEDLAAFKHFYYFTWTHLTQRRRLFFPPALLAKTGDFGRVILIFLGISARGFSVF